MGPSCGGPPAGVVRARPTGTKPGVSLTLGARPLPGQARAGLPAVAGKGWTCSRGSLPDCQGSLGTQSGVPQGVGG